MIVSATAWYSLASHGTRIYVLAGTYREVGDPTNGLTINKSGIKLIGQSNPQKRVILENAGNQRNGIVIVPPEQNDCMSCHSDLANPFPLHEWVEPGLPMGPPVIYDVEVPRAHPGWPTHGRPVGVRRRSGRFPPL